MSPPAAGKADVRANKEQKMKFLATFCKALGYVWSIIAGIVIFIGIVGI
jgi:hypothetical protein